MNIVHKIQYVHVQECHICSVRSLFHFGLYVCSQFETKTITFNNASERKKMLLEINFRNPPVSIRKSVSQWLVFKLPRFFPCVAEDEDVICSDTQNDKHRQDVENTNVPNKDNDNLWMYFKNKSFYRDANVQFKGPFTWCDCNCDLFLLLMGCTGACDVAKAQYKHLQWDLCNSLVAIRKVAVAIEQCERPFSATDHLPVTQYNSVNDVGLHEGHEDTKHSHAAHKQGPGLQANEDSNGGAASNGQQNVKYYLTEMTIEIHIFKKKNSCKLMRCEFHFFILHQRKANFMITPWANVIWPRQNFQNPKIYSAAIRQKRICFREDITAKSCIKRTLLEMIGKYNSGVIVWQVVVVKIHE